MERKDHLLDVTGILYRWRKVIIGTTAATALGAIIIALLLPVYYKSTTIFYAASPDLAKPEAIFGTTTAEINYYGESEDLDRLFTIAQSGELSHFLIDSFKLYDHYDIDPTHPKAEYYIAEEFSDLFDVRKNKFDAIELSVEDTDKLLASNIANAARNKINAIAQNMLRSSQGNMIRTFELNITDANEELQKLGDSLQIIRRKFNIYNPSTQSELLSELKSKAESKLSEATSKKNAFSKIRGFRDSVTIAEANMAAASDNIKQLETTLETFNNGVGVVELLMQQHSTAAEELSETQERFKMMKAAYNTETPAIHLVEPAAPAVVKERPKRSMIVVGSTLIAFVLSCLGVLLFHSYRDVNWKEHFND